MAAAAPVENLSEPVQVTPAVQQALNNFSDTLFGVQDSLTEGQYLALNNAAKQLFEALRSPRVGSMTHAADSRMGVARDVHLGQMHVEIDSYRDQLTSATVTIDSLRTQRDDCAKRLDVVESLCMRLGGSTKTLDTEFELYGLLPQSAFEADRRLRRSASPFAEEDSGDDEDGDYAAHSVNVQNLSSDEEGDGEENPVLLVSPDL